MTRREHFLYSTRSDRQPTNCIAVECSAELIPDNADVCSIHEQLLGWGMVHWTVRDGRHTDVRRYSGVSQVQFWQRVQRQLSRGGLVWCFCYGASRTLALLGFWDRLEDRTFGLTGVDVRSGEDDSQSLGYCVLEDPPTVVLGKIPGVPGTLKIVDVRNYGIRDFGELVTAHSTDPGRDRGQAATAKERTDWCLARAHLLETFARGMISVLERLQAGALQATMGSQAMYSFRRKWLKETLFVHCHTEALSLERAAMHGGRCEMFRAGLVTGPIIHLDYRSLYPSVCIGATLPLRLCQYHASGTVAELSAALRSHCTIAEVSLSTPIPAYPLARDGLVIFPTGRFITALCGPELAYALERGHVEAVHRYATYQGGDALSPYMTDWLAMRAELTANGFPALAAWVKGLLVCLHGKFAQRAKRWVDRKDAVADHPYHSWYRKDGDGPVTRWRSVAWHVQEEVDQGEPDETMPALAAWVFSLGRMRLWAAMEAVGMERCYYVDTDSVWTDPEGVERLARAGLVGDGEVGKLRVVAEHDEATFYGWKHYLAGGKLICAGLPRGHVIDVLDDGTYWQRQWLSAAVIEGRRPDGRIVERKYTRQGGYKHGVIQPDGRVLPWHAQSEPEISAGIPGQE